MWKFSSDTIHSNYAQESIHNSDIGSAVICNHKVIHDEFGFGKARQSKIGQHVEMNPRPLTSLTLYLTAIQTELYLDTDHIKHIEGLTQCSH